jgi:ABC-type multidrug transport system ATPase subunit
MDYLSLQQLHTLAPVKRPPWITVSDVHYTAGQEFDLVIPSLTVPQGRLTALIGANGSGKSTLLNLLVNMLKPQSGGISLGRTMSGKLSLQERNDIGVQLQDASCNPQYSVRRICQLHRAAYTVSDDTVFELFGVPEIARQRFSQLSSGQRQRLQLALALAHRPRSGLFDEPTSNLDPFYEARFIEALLDARARDEAFSALFVTHSAAVVEICDEVLMLTNGRVEAHADKNTLVAAGFGTLGARFEGPQEVLDGVEAVLHGTFHLRRLQRRNGRLTVYGEDELRPTLVELAATTDTTLFSVWKTGAADILGSLRND